MPRLFTAIEVPSQIAMQLSLLQSGLPGARWIDRENLHITLRFVGDVDHSIARELGYALEKVKSSPFSLKLDTLDVFGNAKPHSLYAGVARNPALFDLRAEQERICQRLGLSADSRKFTPHVTIARIRGAKTATIARYLSNHGAFQSLEFPVNRFVLLSSRASVGGGPYVTEETYELVENKVAVA
ncbi:MAG: RNA 2',3'-cyclic phosphodiesterase [Pseudomonadota bacterium]